MENCNLDRYKPVEMALKRVGLKVDELTKYDKKTVITVSPYLEINPDDDTANAGIEMLAKNYR